MDIKASARSKRAQSQRGKSKFSARHSHSQPRQQHKKNEDVKNEKVEIGIEDPAESLPSNWARYEEPHSSGSEDEAPHNRKEEETVPVKSKGADYLYLLSQSQEPSTFDAHLPDYAEGISSMLYIRGQSLLSWGEDDSFTVNKEDTSSDYEASFLSLDLHGLASQLAQLDLSKRLFIEEDILPDELVKKHKVEGEQEQEHSNKSELRVPELPPDLLDVLPSVAAAERSIEKANLSGIGILPKECRSDSALNKDEDAAPHESLGVAAVPRSSGAAAAIPFFASSDSQVRVGAAPHKASRTHLGGRSPIEAATCSSMFENNEKSDEVMCLDRPSCVEAPKQNSICENNEKSNEVTMYMKPRIGQFEAAAAEAELDALLDALDEPAKLGASEVLGTSSGPFFREGSNYKGTEPFQDKLLGSSNLFSVTDNSSCTLDDILGETFDGGHGEGKEKISHHSESAAGGAKSGTSLSKNAPKVLDDDFDAWLDTL